MDSGKPDKLAQLTQTLQRAYGIHAFRLATESVIETIPTGIDVLDEALGIGGIPFGYLTELWSRPSGGCSTLALHLMTQAQTQDQLCVFIDVPETFDPDTAHQHGIDLDRLMLVHPSSVTQALDIAQDFIVAGQVGLIVIGLGLLEKLTSHGDLFRRLSLPISRSKCALVCLALSLEEIDHLALSDATAIRLICEHTQWFGRHGDVTGYTSTIRIAKNKFNVSHQVIPVKITLDKGMG